MSVRVVHRGRTVWSPSLRVARLLEADLAALEKLVETPSGFVIDDSDEVHLDDQCFGTFVAALLDQLERTDNPEIVALAAGPAQVAVALLHRLTGAWPQVSDRLDLIVSSAKSLVRESALP